MFYICKTKDALDSTRMKHKHYFIILILLCFGVGAQAQRYEIGGQVGGSNLVGDIGRTNYLYPIPQGKVTTRAYPIYLNFLFKMNFNPYQSLRLNIGYNSIFFDDNYASEAYRRSRTHHVIEKTNNDVTTVEALFEYNFMPINNEQQYGMFSPYIFGGIGGVFYKQPAVVAVNDFYRDPAGNAIDPSVVDPTGSGQGFKTLTGTGTKSGGAMSFPFGLGVKYKFNYNWTLFAEAIFRPTTADDIDYSQVKKDNVKITYNKDITAADNPRKSLLQTEPYLQVATDRVNSLINQINIGNPKSKDWVNTVSVGVSYSFGRPPCNCGYK